MKFFRIDLLTLLISLFVLSGCKNENTLGLAVDPSQQISGTVIDTSTIVTNTQLEDTVVTSGLASTPLAYFKDPVLGVSEANMATGLSLPTSYVVPTGTVTIDSAVVVLRYANDFYGDSLTSKYKANIYQLAERPNIGTAVTGGYYNTKAWSYNNTVLGSQVFNARSNTSIKITDIVEGAKDTLKTVSPQVRVKIDPNFIQQNLFNASSTVTGSNNLFQNQIKGLYITLDKNQTGSGGRMYFQLDSSRIDVYYKTVSGTTIDTTMTSIPFSSHAGQIKHTYTDAVKTALQGTTNQETVYLDGLIGTRVKVSFPYLKNILASAGNNIVLNRAELVISPSPGTDIPFVPQGKLTMYHLDIAKQRSYLPDAVGGSSTGVTDPRFINANVFGGQYVQGNKEYHFIITGYISDLMRGKAIDYGIYIAPDQNISSTTISVAATPAASGRTIAVGGVTNKNSANYPYRMKLNIIYTKANQ